MKKLLLGCVMAFGLAACGGGGGDMVGQAEGIAKKTCACTDFDCTKKHIAELNKITIKGAKDVAKMSKEDQAKFVAASGKASDCQMKLRTPAKP